MSQTTANLANDAATPPPAGRSIAGLRITSRTGLQGKLVFCFVFLLAVSLGASCWLFVSESHATFDRMTADQAKQVARTLAMASEPALSRGDAAELQRIGADLMKARGLVGVAFFDQSGKPLAIAALDPSLEHPGTGFFGNPRESTADLHHPRRAWTPALGRYVELAVPVSRPSKSEPAGGRRADEVLGYVTVCVSQAEADARGRAIALTVVLIGAVAVLVCWPTMYVLVHRIFAPIRELVSATDKIARGDLDAAVATDRPDVIGTLARSFNEMVNRVRTHRQDLADANDRLANANERLARANQDLEAKVADRTAALERANRRLSAEMADKDDFLRTVSHDLNAPLRNIAGMASMLLMKHRSTFDADVVHRLERIQKNVELETGLIAELLELSRIKTWRQRTEEVDMAALAREVGEVFAQDFEARGVRFVVDGPMPRIVCERARLRQVLQNLVDNAVKYMGDGSAATTLAAAGLPAEGGDAAGRVRAIHVGCRDGGAAADADPEFYVRDTGIGIDPGEQENVFRVFRRGKSQAVQSVAGKGVGLASVKSIVETHGGSIRVESQPGIGSTFRFTVERKHVCTNQETGAVAA